MDQAEKKAYCQHRFDRARDDLETAHVDLDASKWRGAVNRAYYAVFHMASAALLWLGEERAKHSGVQSAFGSALVNAGLIEPEYAKILAQARREREQQDYEFPPKPMTEEKARQIVKDCEQLFARLERYLREVGALEQTTTN